MSAIKDEFIRIEEGKAECLKALASVTIRRHKLERLRLEWDFADHWDPDQLEGIQAKLDEANAQHFWAMTKLRLAKDRLFNPERTVKS